MNFSYKKFPADPIPAFPNRKGVFRPVIPIRIINPLLKDKNIRYECLIDSGADYSIFHAGIGEYIGLDVKKGSELVFQGISGTEQKSYFHEVIIEIGGWECRSFIGFSYDIDNLPYGILGQVEFFDFFEIKFNYNKENIELKQRSR